MLNDNSNSNNVLVGVKRFAGNIVSSDLEKYILYRKSKIAHQLFSAQTHEQVLLLQGQIKELDMLFHVKDVAEGLTQDDRQFKLFEQ